MDSLVFIISPSIVKEDVILAQQTPHSVSQVQSETCNYTLASIPNKYLQFLSLTREEKQSTTSYAQEQEATISVDIATFVEWNLHLMRQRMCVCWQPNSIRKNAFETKQMAYLSSSSCHFVKSKTKHSANELRDQIRSNMYAKQHVVLCLWESEEEEEVEERQLSVWHQIECEMQIVLETEIDFSSCHADAYCFPRHVHFT